jgi:hypothetical protein
MKKNSDSKFGIFNPRVGVAFMLCLAGAMLAMFAFAAPSATKRLAASTSTSLPTFGHPIISGVGGYGFEEDIRLDPSDPNIVYTSGPNSATSDTSWIWHSRDGGKTFKWITSGTPFHGKATACAGGGDSELAVDSAGHLYFADLNAANFGVARSDDKGVTFPCNNTGVPDAVVDRQWYATDGDPVSGGGSIYLVNDEVGPGGAMCGSSLGNNVLVMYRSPNPAVVGPVSTAGLLFGPANKITADLSCDEGIMGNDEVSPVATTLGQPNGSGGFATLATPVKHIFVIHDDANLHQIRLGRCFPVAFGAATPNVSDPSGLNCTDILVAELGATGVKTGGDFPTMAIDKAGNLYAVWEQAPTTVLAGPPSRTVVTGDTVLMYSFSTDEGNTWSTPMQIDTSGSSAGTLHNNVFAWIAAGDDGRVDVVWYGTPGLSNPNDQTCGQKAPLPPPPPGKNVNGPDATTGATWSLWMVQTLNGHAAAPTFTAPILASEHHNHRGTIQTLIGGQCGDRLALGDFLQVRIGPFGEAQISYADSNNIDEALTSHAMYVRQNGGNGVFAASSPVNIPGLTPFNSVSDPSGDGKYEVGGITSANMPQLDITNSSVSEITTAPCSVAAPCYQVVMQLNNLSLAPTTAQDPDIDLVWLTQWLVPSSTDAKGGKNFFVYAESTNGGALTCYSGEAAALSNGASVFITYPGAVTLPAANCLSTLGPNGTITIDVPLSNVNEPGAIDSRLHEVTASTMTLSQPANTVPSTGGIGGVLFNLIDVAQGYTFDPLLPTSVVSRKMHGSAGNFDVGIPLTGTRGVECRSPGQLPGGASGDYELIFTFANNLGSVAGASVSSGTGSVASRAIGPNANQYTVNLAGVANQQYITVTLNNVVDMKGASGDVVSPQLGILVGDVNANGVVSNTDVSLVKGQVTAPVGLTNFREDVNANGVISNTDVSVTKAQVTATLPSPP